MGTPKAEAAPTLKTMSVTEAAAATGMPATAIRRLLDRGELAGNRNGKNWRVSVASLEAWVNKTPEKVATLTAFEDVEDRFS